MGVLVSIPIGVLLSLQIPIAVVGCAALLWLMNKIHPLARRTSAIAALGLAICSVAFIWRDYQKYVLDTPVGAMSRVLSYIGVVVYMSGVYLHGVKRRRERAESSQDSG